MILEFVLYVLGLVAVSFYVGYVAGKERTMKNLISDLIDTGIFGSTDKPNFKNIANARIEIVFKKKPQNEHTDKNI